MKQVCCPNDSFLPFGSPLRVVVYERKKKSLGQISDAAGARISVSLSVARRKAVGIIRCLSEIYRVMKMICIGDDVWWYGSSKEGAIQYRKRIRCGPLVVTTGAGQMYELGGV